MFGIFMFALIIGAGWGLLMLVGSLVMLCIRKLRAGGAALMTGGLSGAVLAFALFVGVVFVGDLSGESLFSQLSASIAAAGFGTGALFGAAVFLLSLLMRSPNRWADRRRSKLRD
jgi:hypothetical protein